jgi:hypothetical protein
MVIVPDLSETMTSVKVPPVSTDIVYAHAHFEVAERLEQDVLALAGEARGG